MTVPPCGAKLYHGPGHQSSTSCTVHGDHDVHRCRYVGPGGCYTHAEWLDGEYTGALRAKGIDFNPESYPENLGMTGFFDEPPQETNHGA